MQAFLNELSFPTLESADAAKILFDSLPFLYKKMVGAGIRHIRVGASFFQIEFAKGYTFYSWIHDGKTDSDYRTLLIDILTTSPYIEDIFKSYEKANNKALEFYYNDKVCYGLGLASDSIFNTIAFSYDNGQWNEDIYGIQFTTLDLNEAGELVEQKKAATTRNITTVQHFDKHKPFIQERIKATITNGGELWRQKVDLFPGLQFCHGVEKQIENMDSSNPDFQQIMNRLFDMQNFTDEWKDEFNPDNFKTKVTPESTTRLNDFKQQLTILCPDGTNKLFSWHARYTPGAGRIHFYPLTQEKKLLIGSIANQNEIK